MKRVLFIYNPQAGQIQIKSQLWDIFNVLADAEYEVTVRPTRRAKEAYAIAKERAKEFEEIICSGGDGTLNEVVSGLLEVPQNERPVLGYIPAGSTNDYAYSLKLPRNMRKAAETVVQGKSRSVDIGSLNKRIFVYVAAFGLFSEVSYETDQQMKNMLGHFAYVIEGALSLSSVKSYHLKVSVDDEVHEANYIYGMVTNSLSVGGIYRMSESDVSLDDGEFEVLLVKEPKTLEDFVSITDFFTDVKSMVPTEMVESFHCRKLKIESSEEVKWALDGEDGGATKCAEFEVLEKAIRIIC